MKVFTCTSFKGYYPTGTAAVIVADDVEQARALLEFELHAYGLGEQEISLDDIKEVSAHTGVTILCDGNY